MKYRTLRLFYGLIHIERRDVIAEAEVMTLRPAAASQPLVSSPSSATPTHACVALLVTNLTPITRSALSGILMDYLHQYHHIRRNNTNTVIITTIIIAYSLQWKTRNSSEDEIANVNFLYDDIVHALQNAIDPCINSARDRRGYVLERAVYQSQWNNAMQRPLRRSRSFL